MEKGKQAMRPVPKQSGGFLKDLMLVGVFLSILVIILSLIFEELPFKVFYLVSFILFLISYHSEKKKEESLRTPMNMQAGEKPKQ